MITDRPGGRGLRPASSGRTCRPSVSPAERADAGGLATPAELALFDAMHVADRRHGLDVVATLRARGRHATTTCSSPGLLHDCGKGDTGAVPRIAWSLGEAFGPWVWRRRGVLPGLGAALDRLRDHADASAELAGGGRAAAARRRRSSATRPSRGPASPAALFKAADEAC